MELGATVCTPRNPACSSCPVKGHCKILHEVTTPTLRQQNHNQTFSTSLCDLCDPECVSSASSCSLYPLVQPRKTARPVRHFAAAAVISGDSIRGNRCGARTIHLFRSASGLSVFMKTRQQEGLLAGHWELPSVEVCADTSGNQDHRRLLDKSLIDYGLNVGANGLYKAGSYRHTFSHVSHVVSLFVGYLKSPPPSASLASATQKWLSLGQTSEVVLNGSSAVYVKKALELLLSLKTIGDVGLKPPPPKCFEKSEGKGEKEKKKKAEEEDVAEAQK
eukprot:GHVS01039671.1.p2 GENE.GHVS01039671.1~~GHVS01039671.1.p2  ORF type:complete len:276 (-),score=40.52 GHVS01039671.1:20-847(-)